MSVRGEFIEGGQGQILIVSHVPETPNGKVVIVFPAMCEEMNKSRRLLWHTGNTLASKGITTLIPDLYGTGDSSGEFIDARWPTWCEDMRRVIAWSKASGANETSALAVRMGAGLLADTQQRFANEIAFKRLVFWEPVASGRKLLGQMLRMKAMAERMSGAKRRSASELEKELLESDQGTEISGYLFHRELAQQVLDVKFNRDTVSSAAKCTSLEWGAAARSDAADNANKRVAVQEVEGQRFWMAAEPSDNQSLVEQTVDLF